MHRPEDPLGQSRIALAIGMGEIVPTRRSRAPYRGQRARVQSEGVADIIEAEAVGDLAIAQRHQLTARAVSFGLLFDPGLPGHFRSQMPRSEVEDLGENGQLRRRWKVAAFGYHPCRMAGSGAAFQHFPLNPVGWLWSKIALSGGFR